MPDDAESFLRDLKNAPVDTAESFLRDLRGGGTAVATKGGDLSVGAEAVTIARHGPRDQASGRPTMEQVAASWGVPRYEDRRKVAAGAPPPATDPYGDSPDAYYRAAILERMPKEKRDAVLAQEEADHKALVEREGGSAAGAPVEGALSRFGELPFSSPTALIRAFKGERITEQDKRFAAESSALMTEKGNRLLGIDTPSAEAILAHRALVAEKNPALYGAGRAVADTMAMMAGAKAAGPVADLFVPGTSLSPTATAAFGGGTMGAALNPLTPETSGPAAMLFMGTTAKATEILKGASPGILRSLYGATGGQAVGSVITQLAESGEVNPWRVAADAAVALAFESMGVPSMRAENRAEASAASAETRAAYEKVVADGEAILRSGGDFKAIVEMPSFKEALALGKQAREAAGAAVPQGAQAERGASEDGMIAFTKRIVERGVGQRGGSDLNRVLREKFGIDDAQADRVLWRAYNEGGIPDDVATLQGVKPGPRQFRGRGEERVAAAEKGLVDAEGHPTGKAFEPPPVDEAAIQGEAARLPGDRAGATQSVSDGLPTPTSRGVEGEPVDVTALPSETPGRPSAIDLKEAGMLTIPPAFAKAAEDAWSDLLLKGKDVGRWAFHNVFGSPASAFPRVTAASSEASDALSGAASARLASSLRAKAIRETMEASGPVDAERAGQAFTEANLRDIKTGANAAAQAAMDLFARAKTEMEAIRDAAKWKSRAFKAKQQEAIDALEQAKAARKTADEVTTTIGREGKPFKTEAEYRAYLASPEGQRVSEEWKAQFKEHVDPLYRHAQDIPMDEPLAERGTEAGGARVNLKRLGTPEEEQAAVSGIPTSAGSRSPMAAKTHASPFGQRATGAAENYDTNLWRMLQHSIERQYENSQFKTALDALVNAGKGVKVGKYDKAPDQIDGEGVVQASQNTRDGSRYYVPRSLAGEFLRAKGIGQRLNESPVVKTLAALNWAPTRLAVAGFVEPTIHTLNIARGLIARSALKMPEGKEAALSALPLRPDIAMKTIDFFKTMLDSSAQKAADIASIAEMGAGREYGKTKKTEGGDTYERVKSANPLKRVMEKADETARVQMLRWVRYQQEIGALSKDPTVARDIINNRFGNYSQRLMDGFTDALRQTGIQPFSVAVGTRMRQDLGTLTFNPQAKYATTKAAVMGRLAMAGRLLGTLMTVGASNAIFSPDHSPLGPPGTKVGEMYFGKKDDGTPRTFDLLRWVGLRGPLRMTGANALINDERRGLTDDRAFGDMFKEAVNYQLGRVAGPGVTFFSEGITGEPPFLGAPRKFPLTTSGRGISQRASDFGNAAKETATFWEPVKAILGAVTGQRPILDVPKEIGGAFSSTSRGYTERDVAAAPSKASLGDIMAFADDVARRVREGEAGGDRDSVRAFVDKIAEENSLSRRDKAMVFERALKAFANKGRPIKGR